jgi:hypothetical protein
MFGQGSSCVAFAFLDRKRTGLCVYVCASGRQP